MICKNLELEISLDDPTYITSKDSMESVIFLTNRIIVTCQSLSHNIVQINGIQVGLELCFSSKKKKKMVAGQDSNRFILLLWKTLCIVMLDEFKVLVDLNVN